MRVGASEEDCAAGTETHLTGEGTEGGGGKLAGAKTLWVATRTAAGRFGGMMKWSWSSLAAM